LEVVIAEIKEAKKKADAAKKKQPPKPDPKPQPKPDVQPVAKGDQPKPAPTASARHPLADARVGEWVRYKVRLPGDANDSSVLVKVTRVTDDTVVFERVLEKGGAQLPLPDKLPRKPLLDSLGVYGKLLSHSVAPDADVAGKRAELLTANLEWPDGTRGELFFSNHIPAYGLWKVVIGRQTVMEAVEWGAPEATEEPATPEKPDSPAAKASPAAPPNGAPSKPEAAAKRPAHPLSDAKVGEWIKVRRVRRGVEFEVTQRVTDADAENVTIQVSVSQEGRAREFPPMTRAKPEELKPVGDVEATYAKETVTVNEKKLECIVMTFERNGVTQKLWICLKLPVDGLVRHEQDGEVIAEVLEWGVDDDS
ncbi:MAG: hypothetical protein OER88_09785, partial [Planctomycetota bacterium]|nr:hypothetical protein [Planctomycetota bacterium]